MYSEIHTIYVTFIAPQDTKLLETKNGEPGAGLFNSDSTVRGEIMRNKNWKSISFSVIKGQDGRWRNSLRGTWYLSRLDAWCAGMQVVRHKLDQFQFAGGSVASERRLSSPLA